MRGYCSWLWMGWSSCEGLRGEIVYVDGQAEEAEEKEEEEQEQEEEEED